MGQKFSIKEKEISSIANIWSASSVSQNTCKSILSSFHCEDIILLRAISFLSFVFEHKKINSKRNFSRRFLHYVNHQHLYPQWQNNKRTRIPKSHLLPIKLTLCGGLWSRITKFDGNRLHFCILQSVSVSKQHFVISPTKCRYAKSNKF